MRAAKEQKYCCLSAGGIAAVSGDLDVSAATNVRV